MRPKVTHRTGTQEGLQTLRRKTALSETLLAAPPKTRRQQAFPVFRAGFHTAGTQYRPIRAVLPETLPSATGFAAFFGYPHEECTLRSSGWTPSHTEFTQKSQQIQPAARPTRNFDSSTLDRSQPSGNQSLPAHCRNKI